MATIFFYPSTKIACYSLVVFLGFAGGARLFRGLERKTTFGVITGISVMIALDFIFSN